MYLSQRYFSRLSCAFDRKATRSEGGQLSCAMAWGVESLRRDTMMVYPAEGKATLQIDLCYSRS